MEASSPHTQFRFFPLRFVKSVYKREKPKELYFFQLGFESRISLGGFPGETEGTWEAAGGALLLQGTGGVGEM